MDDPTFTFRDLVEAARKGRLAIVASMLSFGVLAIVVALIMTPTYRIEVLLSPARGDEAGASLSLPGQLGGLAAMVGVNVNDGDARKQEAIALLRSRYFIEQFIEEENLLPVLFADRWDAATQSWQQSFMKKVPTLGMGFYEFDRGIRRIGEDRSTGLVVLTIDWRDRYQAAEWARKLVARVNEHMRLRAIEEAQRSIQYLERERDRTGVVEVQQAIYRLIEDQIKTIMLANVREEFAFRIIDPGVIPDDDDFIRPKRVLIIVLGFVLGLFVGIVFVFFKYVYRAAD